MHVYPECAAEVLALDVQAQASPEDTLRQAQTLVGSALNDGLLVLVDIFGATPANVAQQLVSGSSARLISGVNLPMLLRSVCYRHESLDALATRAQAGGAQGIISVGCTAPQNQSGPRHAPSYDDHQQ